MKLPLSVVAPVLFDLHGRPQDIRRVYRVAILSEGFLSSEMPAFRKAATAVAKELIATQPFKRMRDRIYIARIDCTSLASAQVLTRLTPPPNSYVNKTPFEVRYSLTIARHMTGNRAALRDVLGAVPGLPPITASAVIVNNDESGGTADGDASWFTLVGVEGTFVHELGHAGFGLGDEYDYRTGASGEQPQPYSSTSEPIHPNLTLEKNANSIPWRTFFTPNVPIPSTRTFPCRFDFPPKATTPSGAVGLFQGGGQAACGIFRPSLTCKMRDHSDDFCVVCERTIFGQLAGAILDNKPPFVVRAEPWTHAVAVPPRPAEPKIFDIAVYNSQTGVFAICPGNDFKSQPQPTPLKPVGRTQLEPGFTTMACFTAGANRFVYVDSFFTHRRMIFRIDEVEMFIPGQPGLVTKFAKPAGVVPPFGPSHMLPLAFGGQAFLLHYDRATGALELELFEPLTQQPVVVASTAAGSMAAWHPLLSTLTSVTIGGIPFVVGLDATARKVFIARVAITPGLTASLTDVFVSTGLVLPFQTHAMGFEFHNVPMLFTYSTLGGTASIYEVRRDLSGIDFIYGWTLAPGASAMFDVGLPAFGFIPEESLVGPGLGRLWAYNAGLSRFTGYVLR